MPKIKEGREGGERRRGRKERGRVKGRGEESEEKGGREMCICIVKWLNQPCYIFLHIVIIFLW